MIVTAVSSLELRKVATVLGVECESELKEVEAELVLRERWGEVVGVAGITNSSGASINDDNEGPVTCTMVRSMRSTMKRGNRMDFLLGPETVHGYNRPEAWLSPHCDNSATISFSGPSNKR